jgi:hypothetical protein
VPHWIVLDEAHDWLRARSAAGPTVRVVEGKGLCLVTSRVDVLGAAADKALDVLVLGRTHADADVAALGAFMAEHAPGHAPTVSMLPDLARGEFLLAPLDGVEGVPLLTFSVAQTLAEPPWHLRGRPDRILPRDHRFLFRRASGELVATADSLAAFREVVRTVDAGVLAHHAQRGDFSRWVVDVFADLELGARLEAAEQRWGCGRIRDLRQAIRRLVPQRSPSASTK